MAERVLMAYSGGLKGTLCIHWLRHHLNLEVVTFAANLGFGETLATMGDHAIDAGATAAHISDLREKFLTRYAIPALRAEAAYEAGYLLSAALGRAAIAEEMVDLAGEHGCRFVAHGATAKGNDAVRYQTSIGALAPDLQIIAPLREGPLATEEARQQYVERHGIRLPRRHARNFDGNLWGVTIEDDAVVDLDTPVPEHLYVLTVPLAKAPDRPERVRIGFEQGVPVSLDGRSLPAIELVETLNRLGGKHGIGRLDVVEDRLVGLKTREIYEAPAATLLHRAHHALEDIVLSGDLREYKARIAWKYGETIYSGRWFSRLRRAFDGFVDETQRVVTGTVQIEIYKGNILVVGRDSPYSLYDKELATFGPNDPFDASASVGFAKLVSLPSRVAARRQPRG